MDKYTYNVKADKILKLTDREDYATAVKIADTMDWEGVRSIRLLTATATAYEAQGDYRTAMELLDRALEQSSTGRRLLYRLTDLAIRDRNLELAQQYYDQYLQEAQDDNARYLLRYRLSELKGEPLDKRIAILETYRKYEFEEEWTLRLAELYDQAGMGDACVKLCDEIILWFGVGENVDRAMELKEKYTELSSDQEDRRRRRDYYEQRYQNVVDTYNGREAARLAAEIKAHARQQSREAAGAEQTPQEAALQQANAELAADYDWTRQFCLVEAESAEMAVEKTLEFMAEYYNARELPMGSLTGITADKLNRLGTEGLRRGGAGKDVLILGAQGLTDELLEAVISLVRDEHSPQLMILAEDSEHMTGLDERLTALVNAAAEPALETAAGLPGEEAAFELQPAFQETVAAGESLWQDDAADSFREEAQQLTNGEEMPAQQPAAEEVPTIELLPVEEVFPEAEEKPVGEELPASEIEQPAAQEAPRAAEEAAAQEEISAEAEIPGAEDAPAAEEVPAAEETPAAAAPAAEEEPLPDLCLDDLLRMNEQAQPIEEAPAEEAEISIAIEDELPAITLIPEETSEIPAKEQPEQEKLALQQERLQFCNALIEQDEEELARPLNFVFEEQKETAAPAQTAAAAEEKAGEVPAPQQQPAAATTVLPRLKKETEAKAAPAVTAATQRIDRRSVKTAAGDTNTITSTRHLQKITGMSEEAFTEYAFKYVASIDCVMADGTEEAFRDMVAGLREEDRILTKELAEDLIEEAADRAENKKGLFVKRYDREGNLILRPENFA